MVDLSNTMTSHLEIFKRRKFYLVNATTLEVWSSRVVGLEALFLLRMRNSCPVLS